MITFKIKQRKVFRSNMSSVLALIFKPIAIIRLIWLVRDWNFGPVGRFSCKEMTTPQGANLLLIVHMLFASQ